ncbi:MAG: hypothetical protein ABSE48_15625 [Verrucomicrobiota bacterium]
MRASLPVSRVSPPFNADALYRPRDAIQQHLRPLFDLAAHSE